jgi:hypothetical protein
MQVGHRWSVTAGVALVGAGVLAVTPTTAPLPGVHRPDIQLTAGDEAQDIVIDIVRHGQREGVAALVVPSPPYPGAPLSDQGVQESKDVADQLYDELGPVSGIYSGQGIRDIDTAVPFAELEYPNADADEIHDHIQVLPGLDEIAGSVYGALPHLSPGGILYALTTGAWGLGFELVPMPGSSAEPNGVEFNENFTGAVNTMYHNGVDVDDPVISNNGEVSAVAFNNEASIAAWVLMNVKNPDLSFFATHANSFNELEHPILPTGHFVEIKGNPEDGWTLVSWDGTDIPQDPGLLTDLFVDFRDLIMAPQTAAWHIYEAILGGDQDEITNAIQNGFENVGEAISQFPGAVFNDISDALSLGADMI